jgi:hypothetical protein
VIVRQSRFIRAQARPEARFQEESPLWQMHSSSTPSVVQSANVAVGLHAYPPDLGAHVVNALMARTGIDPAAVEDFIVGCVDQVGAQAANVARTIWLAAGLPEHVPAVTVDRQCGSSQQAISFAAQAVMAGVADMIIAGGVQSMSQVPLRRHSPSAKSWAAPIHSTVPSAFGGVTQARRYPSSAALNGSPNSGTSLVRRWSSSQLPHILERSVRPASSASTGRSSQSATCQ